MTAARPAAVRLSPLLLFGLLAAGLVLAEHYIVCRPDFAHRPGLAVAVAADLLLVLPVLFYLLVVRQYQLPLNTLAAAFGVGLALSHWLLPAASLPLMAWAGRLGAGLEACILGYMLLRLRRIRQQYVLASQQSTDFIDNLETACRPVLGRLTSVVVTEAAVWRYALLAGPTQTETGSREQAFSTYQHTSLTALLAVAGLLGIVEAGAAHLVIGLRYPAAAWVLTALSVYSLLLLLAHGRAVRQRPVTVSAQTLAVRVGLGWRARIPRGAVLAAEKISDVPPAAPDLLNAAALLFTPPNVLLTLAAPQLVCGPYGLRRHVSRLAIYVDEPAAFQQALLADQ